jgi:light-regulated signal transduction histidine kinase (bacteriophytochrome)
VIGASDGSRIGSAPRRPSLAAAVSHAPGTFDSAGEDWYLASAPIPGSTWHLVMATTTERLFTSLGAGRTLIAWLLFGAFALAAGAALWLVARLLRADRQLAVAYESRRAAHEETEKVNAELSERASELARSNTELERFAAIASHDLQEPLRKIRAFGEELELSYSDRLGEDGRRHVARMRGATGRMQTLVEDLLRLARIGTLGAPFHTVELGEVVSAAASDLSMVLEDAGAELQVESLPSVAGDRAQLEQLFRNLLSNSVKFRRPDVRPMIRISARRCGDDAEITLADNGIGFDAVMSEQIFGIFERLHPRQELPGTGIGLAVCRKIVERHGGTITAVGEPGEGARMTVTLPLATGAPAAVAPEGERVAGAL